MALPGAFENPQRDATDLYDEKAKDAYEEGHDADLRVTKHPSATKDGTRIDLEKGLSSNRASTISGDDTLGGGTPATGAGASGQGEEINPDIVDWEGPDDPHNPQNWTARKKWSMIGALAAVTLVT